eukprot:CFRG0707T1
MSQLLKLKPQGWARFGTDLSRASSFSTATHSLSSLTGPGLASNSGALCYNVNRTGRRNARGYASSTEDDSAIANSSFDVTDVTQSVAESVTQTLSQSSSWLTDPITGVIATGAQAGEVAAAGLNTWAPAGLMRNVLENTSVFLDLPWWATIIGVTISYRLLMLPLATISQRNNVNMKNIKPDLEKFQEEGKKYLNEGQPEKAKESTQAMWAFMDKNNVSYKKLFLQPGVNLPIAMSMFFGLRAMADVPIASMVTGGALWFTDLTVADPTWALPVLSGITTFITIELGAEGQKASEQTKQMRTILRIMPWALIPMVASFPTALLTYWCTNNVFSLCQVMFFKVPIVRKALRIPDEVVHAANPTKLGFWESFEIAKNAEVNEMNEAAGRRQDYTTTSAVSGTKHVKRRKRNSIN